MTTKIEYYTTPNGHTGIFVLDIKGRVVQAVLGLPKLDVHHIAGSRKHMVELISDHLALRRRYAAMRQFDLLLVHPRLSQATITERTDHQKAIGILLDESDLYRDLINEAKAQEAQP